MDSKFKFQLGDVVMIAVSGEQGTIVGRCEFSNASNSYLIRYCAKDGKAVEQYWSEDALAA